MWMVSLRCASTCACASPSCGWTAWGTPHTCRVCHPRVWLDVPGRKQHCNAIKENATLGYERSCCKKIYQVEIITHAKPWFMKAIKKLMQFLAPWYLCPLSLPCPCSYCSTTGSALRLPDTEFPREIACRTVHTCRVFLHYGSSCYAA